MSTERRMSDRRFRKPRPRGRALYAERPEISPHCKILSNFVKSAFLRNHLKPAPLKAKGTLERSDGGL